MLKGTSEEGVGRAARMGFDGRGFVCVVVWLGVLVLVLMGDIEMGAINGGIWTRVG